MNSKLITLLLAALCISQVASAEFSAASGQQTQAEDSSSEDESPLREAAIRDIAMEKGIEDGRAHEIERIERSINPKAVRDLDVALDTSHLYLQGGRVRPGLVVVTANGTKSTTGDSVEETRLGYKLMETEKFTTEKIEWRNVLFRVTPSSVTVPAVLQKRTPKENAIWESSYAQGFKIGRDLALDEIQARNRWLRSRILGMYDWTIASLPGGVLKNPSFATRVIPVQGDKRSLSVDSVVHEKLTESEFKTNVSDYER